MVGTETLRDSLTLILTVLIFLVLMGVFIIWSYNFMAVSDEKLFDAENKYINGSLPNPDFEDNYKDTYKNKRNFDNIQLNLTAWFNSTGKIFTIAFLSMLLFGLILTHRKKILENFKNFF